jgi:hypothetical protein
VVATTSDWFRSNRFRNIVYFSALFYWIFPSTVSLAVNSFFACLIYFRLSRPYRQINCRADLRHFLQITSLFAVRSQPLSLLVIVEFENTDVQVSPSCTLLFSARHDALFFSSF